MKDLQKLSKEDLSVLIEQLEGDIDKLEFKIDIGRASGFPLEMLTWNRYHNYLSMFLQLVKNEKKGRIKNDSKRINKRTTKD